MKTIITVCTHLAAAIVGAITAALFIWAALEPIR